VEEAPARAEQRGAPNPTTRLLRAGSGGGGRILVLEGGGQKAYAALTVLVRLEEQLQAHGLSITTAYDLIVGTSAGGATALALLSPMVAAKGVAGIRELLELLRERVWQRASSSTYATLSRAQAKVSEADVSSFLAEAVGPLLSFDPDGPLPPPSDRTPYLALTTTYATPTEFRTGLVRNYEAPQEELASLARFTVTEALKATTAAPTYLPPLIKDGRFYFDGGLNANSPSFEALVEFNRLFPGKRVSALTVIGCGDFALGGCNGEGASVIGWAQTMATIACAPTRADMTCKQLAAANALGLAPDAYERISLPFDTETTYTFKLDEHREAVTRTFEAKSLKLLDEPKVTMQLRKVVAQLHG